MGTTGQYMPNFPQKNLKRKFLWIVKSKRVRTAERKASFDARDLCRRMLSYSYRCHGRTFSYINRITNLVLMLIISKFTKFCASICRWFSDIVQSQIDTFQHTQNWHDICKHISFQDRMKKIKILNYSHFVACAALFVCTIYMLSKLLLCVKTDSIIHFNVVGYRPRRSVEPTKPWMSVLWKKVWLRKAIK
jgi:hypothetical protein